MNSDEIYEKVTASADRFGAGNPQQFAFLASVLAKCEQQQVAKALINIFKKENSYERQELGGQLLVKIQPRYAADVHTIIQSVLGHWNRSVEQLPHYLASTYGADICNQCLKEILELEPDENKRNELETMLWWIRNQHN